MTDVYNSSYIRNAEYYAIGHAMTRAISWWPLTVDAFVTSQASPCRICGEQSEADMSVSMIPPLLVQSQPCCALIFHSSTTGMRLMAEDSSFL